MPRSTVTAALLVVITATSAYAQVNDHLKCYKIKDAIKLAGTADLDTPQFGVDPGCTLSKAKFFCVPGTKTNVTAIDKATNTPITPLAVSGPDPGDRICYKVKCPVIPGDQTVTDQFGTRMVTKFKASYLCTPAFKGSARFVDNGDGTVTDNQTGLQWEKKTTAVGSGANPADPHDVDNLYTWGDLAGCPYTGCPNGAAFTDFLGRLNDCTSSDGTAVTNAGFAGHCDWRLPTIQELQTIVDSTQGDCGGGSGPCIDPIFGPTVANDYWSGTTHASTPAFAWLVGFIDGSVFNDFKNSTNYVRAVRGGS
jgi:hypothetical protein